MKSIILFLCMMVISCFMILTSCESITLPTKNYSKTNAASFSVNTTMTQDSLWTVNIPSSMTRAGETSPTLYYMYYIFNAKGNALWCGGKGITDTNATNSYPGTFNKIDSVGSYTCYGLLNIAIGEYTKVEDCVTMTTDQTFTLLGLHDVCLGKQTFYVTADKLNYSVNVNVSHIMAKLALEIKNVPADITSITVSLPQESNVFNFKGEFSGSSQADTLSVAKASKANDDGTYNWSIKGVSGTEEIVFPCTLSSMPITVVASDGNKSYTFNTTSSVVCTSGTRTSLSTSWSTITSTKLGMTVASWTGTQQSDTFDLGVATVK